MERTTASQTPAGSEDPSTSTANQSSRQSANNKLTLPNGRTLLPGHGFTAANIANLPLCGGNGNAPAAADGGNTNVNDNSDGGNTHFNGNPDDHGTGGAFPNGQQQQVTAALQATTAIPAPNATSTPNATPAPTAKANRRARNLPPHFPWTAEEEEKLRRAKAEGMTSREIARVRPSFTLFFWAGSSLERECVDQVGLTFLFPPSL